MVHLHACSLCHHHPLITCPHPFRQQRMAHPSLLSLLTSFKRIRLLLVLLFVHKYTYWGGKNAKFHVILFNFTMDTLNAVHTYVLLVIGSIKTNMHLIWVVCLCICGFFFFCGIKFNA